MGTLKPQSNGLLCSNTVIGILAVGCYIWNSEKGPGLAVAPSSPLLAVPNVTAQPSTAMYQLHIIRCGTIIAFALSEAKLCIMQYSYRKCNI